MRTQSFQYTMLRLALIAALLLALLPTIVRVLAAGFPVGADASAGKCPMSMAMAGMNQMSGMGGMFPLHGSTPHDPVPIPKNHDDCAYCPLLGALAGLTVLIVLLVPQRATCMVRTQWSSPRIVAACPCGIGSRGPPLTV